MKFDLSPELLQKELNYGLSCKEIAEKHGWHVATIHKYVKLWKLRVIAEPKTAKHKKDELLSENKGKYYNEIVRLRSLGYSYKEICETLNCSKSTVSYYLSKQTRNNVKERNKKWKEENTWVSNLSTHVSAFRLRENTGNKTSLKTSVQSFKRRGSEPPSIDYNYKDVLKHFGGTIVKCGLTGRIIDITKDKYSLDHIIPVSRGGSNELSNMSFTIPEANFAKNNMTNEEFVALCKEVCEHFGYTVVKN